MKEETYTTLGNSVQRESICLNLDTGVKTEKEKSVSRQSTLSRRFWVKIILIIVMSSMLMSAIISIPTVFLLKSSFNSQNKPGNVQDQTSTTITTYGQAEITGTSPPYQSSPTYGKSKTSGRSFPYQTSTTITTYGQAEITGTSPPYQSSPTYGKSKTSGRSFPCAIVEFDRSTLHSMIYISKENKTISNFKLQEEMEKGNGSFRKYKGTRGTKGFSEYDSAYYEINVYYEILQHLKNRNLAFELGFSTKDTIDGHHYVGYQLESWSMHAEFVSANKSIDIFSEIEGGTSHHIKTLSSGTPNTIFRGTFGFFINGLQREIICFERRDHDLEKLYIFTNVNFSKQIFPVFGLYNKNLFNVALTLRQ